RTAHDVLDVDRRGRPNLAEHAHPAGTGRRLARDPSVGVVDEVGIEHGVGYAIAELVGMPGRYGLGREQASEHMALLGVRVSEGSRAHTRTRWGSTAGGR